MDSTAAVKAASSEVTARRTRPRPSPASGSRVCGSHFSQSQARTAASGTRPMIRSSPGAWKAASSASHAPTSSLEDSGWPTTATLPRRPSGISTGAAGSIAASASSRSAASLSSGSASAIGPSSRVSAHRPGRRDRAAAKAYRREVRVAGTAFPHSLAGLGHPAQLFRCGKACLQRIPLSRGRGGRPGPDRVHVRQVALLDPRPPARPAPALDEAGSEPGTDHGQHHRRRARSGRSASGRGTRTPPWTGCPARGAAPSTSRRRHPARPAAPPARSERAAAGAAMPGPAGGCAAPRPARPPRRIRLGRWRQRSVLRPRSDPWWSSCLAGTAPPRPTRRAGNPAVAPSTAYGTPPGSSRPATPRGPRSHTHTGRSRARRVIVARISHCSPATKGAAATIRQAPRPVPCTTQSVTRNDFKECKEKRWQGSFASPPSSSQACPPSSTAAPQAIESTLVQLASQVAPLGSDWAGSGQARFLALWQQWQTSSRQLHQALADISVLMRQASVAYEANDTQVAASFR